jgi:uncharacterized membrane protein
MIKRSSQPQWFFSQKEKTAITEAVQLAEKQTSGEIRVHLEKKARENFMGHAQHVFEEIGMTQTEKRNGVLIFIGIKSRQFAILGDQGINEVVPKDFWDEIKESMLLDFKQDRFADGVLKAIEKTGEKLKTYFPYQKEDSNEIRDCISYSL